MTETASLTTSEVADKLGTDGKTLRKFLRSHLPKDQQPGQGSRYSISTKDVPALQKAFEAWGANKAKKADDAEPTADKPKPAKSKRSSKKAAPVVEDEVIDDLDDAEPTTDELDDIEDLDLD